MNKEKTLIITLDKAKEWYKKIYHFKELKWHKATIEELIKHFKETLLKNLELERQVK